MQHGNVATLNRFRWGVDCNGVTMMDSYNGPGLLKYFTKSDPDLYSGTVVGRTPDGFPMIGGHPMMLKQDEVDNLELINNFKARFFCLWKPEDMEQYLKVMDHVSNREFFVKQRINIDVPDAGDDPGGSLKVYLEWVQVEAVTAGSHSRFRDPGFGVGGLTLPV